VFACGVDIVGPSNLVTLLQAIPPYWESEIERLTNRVGDHRTEAGRKYLYSVSPISRVDQITKPLLIGQGANDPRVKEVESDSIVKAMQAKNIPVTYVLYPDEGHGFARPENRKSFNAVSEIFLAQCLGGPYEPLGTDLEGSSLTVPAGKENIATLASALAK
jgi:dipeptidyl aminopeptidase/acylaminoacyl peptidase